MNEETTREYYERNPEGVPGIPSIPEIYEMHRIFERHVREDQLGNLLDVGCGKGYLGETLSKYPGSYFGCDISNSAIEIAKKRIAHGSFVRGTITDLPYPDAFFDCVVCSEVLEHVPDYSTAIKELSRVTKPNKRILISTPNKINPDMLWRTFWKGKYTNQIYDKPIYYKHLLDEFEKYQLELIEFFSFFYLPVVGEYLPVFVKKPAMFILEKISQITNRPLGLYLFFSLRKRYEDMWVGL